MGWRGDCDLNMPKDSTSETARKANITFRRGCPAVELPGTADGKDSALLGAPCSRNCNATTALWFGGTCRSVSGGPQHSAGSEVGVVVTGWP